ncbi:hypothetical protein [Micromonospora parathelypteridis]|uniref:Lipoprotein n=1 Tax=Micromonospora parathelypteridis TaxID=1839617 RepID=A0A840VQK5_9ACTN|nr:hypothetical protein [Micromonospora parathelypteridis]MBB5479433.1 hypothetical protein [Micromonospora parathelypteridis]
MSPHRTRRRLGSTALVCAAVAVCLLSAGCSEYRDGDSMARNDAAAEAESLNESLGHRSRVRDAEYIAATEILDAAEGGTSNVRREPLAWSGRTGGDEQASIDVRFVATVEEDSGATFGDLGNSAGQATRCYRYLLQLYRYTSFGEIDCPSVVTPPVPTAAPFPTLPDDARDRLTAALRTATPDTLAGAVRAAFPEKHVTVDTTTHDNALVAAVGVPAERDCLLLVRTPGGGIQAPGYDPVWLEPGEMGCRTGLYVSPPR